MKRKFWLLSMVGALLLSAAPVLADGDFYVVAVGGGVGTKITSLPYEIKAPGFYYLIGNLTCPEGNGITVASDDVTIDLMGFRLNGNPSGKGIYLNGRKNVEVRNGTVNGWNIGVCEDNAAGYSHRVINIRAASNSNGISLYGFFNLVKGCSALDNQNGIFNNRGIVRDNHVTGSAGIGINSSGTISQNYVANCGTGIRGNSNINSNTVFNCNYGIDCSDPGGGGGVLTGNSVTTFTGQTGFKLSTYSGFPTVLDQNSVRGDGTHYAGGSSATVWAGSRDAASSLWGNNAGHE